jgi:pimeloyl-ACP methyl ester carboxylesterase
MDVTARALRFGWDGVQIELGIDEAGSGPSVVLLPALSSICTRMEMRSLFDRLAPQLHVHAVDWPGFGDRARPQHDCSPEALSAFVDWLLSAPGAGHARPAPHGGSSSPAEQDLAERALGPPPHRIVAAGHAATYALYQAAARPGTIDRLVLVAPTWRGPPPTLLRRTPPWLARVRAAIDRPVFDPLLYRLNLNRFVVRMMARGHVYSAPAWLAGERLAAKLAVTRAPGARHASVRFVTGALDRIATREALFLDLARRAQVPVLVVYGAETPPKSRAEREALAELPGMQVKRLPKGKLALAARGISRGGRRRHRALPERTTPTVPRQ